MTLSIIIVSYNAKYFLEQCLCSVREAIANISAEVIVIDNLSSDDCIGYLQPQFPWVRFILNDTNAGFARANNKALQMASGQYILFLNPDTILAEDTLTQCIFFFENNTGAGAVGVRMLDGSGAFLPESKRSFPSPQVAFYKLLGLSYLFPASHRFGKYALLYLPEKSVHEIDVVSGAFMMIPKQVLAASGSFDEQFFMYAEDIDLSYRIQKNGYKNFYLGQVTIVHFKGESTAKNSFGYVTVFYKAMNLFVKKWYRGSRALLLQKGLQAGIAVRGLAAAIHLKLIRKKKSPQVNYEEIILIGNSGQTKLAANIMGNYFPNKKISYVTDFSPEKRANKNKLVVFCTGILSYKKSIELLQQQTATSYKWFGKGSRSVVGSDSKNKSGEVLT